jgi:hypothetical protein
MTAGALGETVMDCSVTLLPGLEGVEGVEEWVDPPPPPQPIKNASMVNAASTLNVDLFLICNSPETSFPNWAMVLGPVLQEGEYMYYLP